MTSSISTIGSRLRQGDIHRNNRTIPLSKETHVARSVLLGKRKNEGHIQSPKALVKKLARSKDVSSTALKSRIIETNNFVTIKSHIKPKSLILLDLDNTIMETTQTLGSDQWFRWRIEFYKKNGFESGNALETALMEWVSIQCMTKVQLVEKTTDKVVAYMQQGGFKVMGLTTRGATLATRTVQQLKTVDIDLLKTAPTAQEVVFLNPHEVIFKNGILFTAGTHKGHALFKFLEKIKTELGVDVLSEIDEILFINDRLSDLKQIEESCLERKIPFVGLRYGHTDEKVKNFPEDIALQQFEHFGKIITDEQAKINLESMRQ